MKNNTYNRRSQMLSTVKKSQAHDPGGLLAQEHPPGGHPPRCWVESVAAQRRSDCGCRDPNP
jgi:hypothetical protein